MTAVVGVLCSDGVVMGADSSATSASASGLSTIEQPTNKLSIIGDRILTASSGSVGLKQRFERIVEDAREEEFWRTDHYIDVGRRLSATAINDFSSTGIGIGKIGLSALVAFYSDSQPRLCELASRDFQPEFKDENIWYVSIGSGQLITDPFLALMRNIFWDEGMPTVQDAILTVTWTLEHVVEVNPGGINKPIRIAILQEDSQNSGNIAARLLDDADLQEAKEHIDLLKMEIKGHVDNLHESTEVPVFRAVDE